MFFFVATDGRQELAATPRAESSGGACHGGSPWSRKEEVFVGAAGLDLNPCGLAMGGCDADADDIDDDGLNFHSPSLCGHSECLALKMAAASVQRWRACGMRSERRRRRGLDSHLMPAASQGACPGCQRARPDSNSPLCQRPGCEDRRRTRPATIDWAAAASRKAGAALGARGAAPEN